MPQALSGQIQLRKILKLIKVFTDSRDFWIFSIVLPMKKKISGQIFQVECLRYTVDSHPGIRREQSADNIFRYYGPDGKEVRDSAALERISSLAIPPAWQDVWIAPGPDGHIQATGRDAKGRKQYLYHPQWSDYRSATKFYRTVPFAESLPHIRRHTAEDLSLRGLPRAKVLATIVRLLEHTLIRIGNREYAKSNQSFGLSTLQDKHLVVADKEMMFHFHGKSGKEHRIKIHDRRLAGIIKRLNDLPGSELFQYYDSQGEHRVVDSADVNAYLREITGEDFTAKDFRTWGGTVIAAAAFADIGPFRTEAEAKRNVSAAIKRAAERLGNRPAICGKYYVHPAVTRAYLTGKLAESIGSNNGPEEESTGLRNDERWVMEIVKDYDREMEAGKREGVLCEVGVY